jgi:glycine betaine/proline transport system substrate-binding protein
MSLPKPFWLKFVAVFAVMALLLAACTGDDDDTNGNDTGAGDDETTWDQPIVFGDFNWDSAMFHNRVAQFIVEHGYGYETDTLAASTLPMLEGLKTGQVHAVTEMWVENLPESYHEDVEAGEYVDLGANYSESIQGWFVPTFVIEGDAERGIEPMAPDLSHVDDLAEYHEVFEDPEDPSKGRIYHGVGGWEATEISQAKVEAYGLSEYFNGFMPGSEAALFASLQAAYERGDAWLGYLWAPSWPFAMLDLTQIEEPEYSDECWEDIKGGEEACAFPIVRVNIVVNPEFAEGAPEVVELLRNYTSTLEDTSASLLYIAQNDVTPDEAAIWWLQENEDEWSTWVPDDVAERVRDALDDAS